ncbi:MAG: tRNA preQ1(34) S-adenosylmethionine ribosyltransferase-isomerase QueA [Chloroflexia bacterium]|nr:tRNA preQ1(34) S-adenosylmethionine ribosyltransferase-isomerase QueA [Chloroflexia bacterium]
MNAVGAARFETYDLETAAYDYDLPPELIAQTPLDRRDESRLMILDKESGAISHSQIKDLENWLTPGDLLVANNSRVIPARLRGVRKPSGGAVELLLLRSEGGVWRALGRPAKKLQPGSWLEFASIKQSIAPARAIVEANIGDGEILVRFEEAADDHLCDYGLAPLPPYITNPLIDGDRYQTVYGSVPGSAAAPTAGLHFTGGLIASLRAQGIGWTEVTLHVGLDTFRPVAVDLIKDHRIHQEWCEVSVDVASEIARCRLRGGRVVAVGTTAARALETVGNVWRDEKFEAFAGMTDTFIVPGHRWLVVDALLTNFHLPRSSLLMMVSALAGRESILGAYAEAIQEKYRFYSLGDAMMIR